MSGTSRTGCRATHTPGVLVSICSWERFPGHRCEPHLYRNDFAQSLHPTKHPLFFWPTFTACPLAPSTAAPTGRMRARTDCLFTPSEINPDYLLRGTLLFYCRICTLTPVFAAQTLSYVCRDLWVLVFNHSSIDMIILC